MGDLVLKMVLDQLETTAPTSRPWSAFKRIRYCSSKGPKRWFIVFFLLLLYVVFGEEKIRSYLYFGRRMRVLAGNQDSHAGPDKFVLKNFKKISYLLKEDDKTNGGD